MLRYAEVVKPRLLLRSTVIRPKLQVDARLYLGFLVSISSSIPLRFLPFRLFVVLLHSRSPFLSWCNHACARVALLLLLQQLRNHLQDAFSKTFQPCLSETDHFLCLRLGYYLRRCGSWSTVFHHHTKQAPILSHQSRNQLPFRHHREGLYPHYCPLRTGCPRSHHPFSLFHICSRPDCTEVRAKVPYLATKTGKLSSMSIHLLSFLGLVLHSTVFQPRNMHSLIS